MQSRRLAFSDRWIRSRTVADAGADFRDTTCRGLILRVLPGGASQFSVRYRIKGKQRRLVLGNFPALQLSQARVKAARALLKAHDGEDPAAELRASKARPTDTVNALAADYLKYHARPHKRSAGEDERLLNADVLPAWGDRAVRSITKRDVRALLQKIVDRGSGVMANRALSVIRRMLNFGVDLDWIEANPAARIKRPTDETSRERILTDDEIRRIWRLLERQPDSSQRPAPGRKSARRDRSDDPLCPVSEQMAALLKVRFLTAQRGGEVARMRWADLDLNAGWWTIPQAHTKNKQPHRVPLAEDVIALIRTQERHQIGGKGGTENASTPFVFAGVGTSMLDRAKKAPAAIAAALDIDFRGHDLRRTAATRMAAAGIPSEHISAVLNHIQGGPTSTRVYVRYDWDNEKRIALETWARVLRKVIDGGSVAVVRPFARPS